MKEGNFGATSEKELCGVPDHFVELELQLVPSEQGACCDGSRHDEVENPVLVALDHPRQGCYVSKCGRIWRVYQRSSAC